MRILFFILCIGCVNPVFSQELQAKFTVNAAQVSTKVDKRIFQTLQAALTNLLNNRRWTTDVFQPQEKIKCNFLLNIDEDKGNNIFKASLLVQAARPIYNSNYESPIVNFQDNDVVFKYVEFQPVEFNENRIQGADPLVANLTAVIAYYVSIILGLDYDSFGPRGGDPYFQKAQLIVNNAPESRDISGWKAFDGLRNRFKLAQNFTDSRFTLVHDALYSYYRTGMDLIVDNEDEGRNGVLNALNFLNTINQENPNSMVIQFFFQGKSNELAKLFSKANTDVKSRARDLLLKMDLTNANAYKELK